MGKHFFYYFLLLSIVLTTTCPAHGKEPVPSLTETVTEKQAVLKLEDDLHRDTPRSTVSNFLAALRNSDFQTASHYLDFRYLPKSIANIPPEELTRKMKVILDRAVWVDLAALSNDPEGYSDDNLPSYREFLAKVELNDKKIVNLLLQKVPGDKGFQIWKFSNRSVAQIPAMYQIHGYTEMEQRFVDVFPEYEILGWQIWQWIIALTILFILFIIITIVFWCIAYFLRRKKKPFYDILSDFLQGPIRYGILLFLSANIIFRYVTPSVTLRSLAQLQTLRLLVILWIVFSLIELGKNFAARKLEKRGLQNASVLLRPARTMLRILMLVLVSLVWLDNMGMSIATILTGLGVGGLAFALAAQDTLKNLIGSVIILLDKPYVVGQRIMVAGHDGEVEEIGLRSTKLRLLNGHQSIIPNEMMARTDIENIGRRPHIRRKDTIALPYDTPLAKVKEAVTIIRGILDNHEGMVKGKPAQVYFASFQRDSLGIVMCYWYHPAEYWNYMAFSQKVNEQIMEQFEANNISFALPTNRTFLEQ
jgi:MscS family membrane protein